jgi:hypothetical protein
LFTTTSIEPFEVPMYSLSLFPVIEKGVNGETWIESLKVRFKLNRSTLVKNELKDAT